MTISFNSFIWKHYRDAYVEEKVRTYGQKEEVAAPVTEEIVQKTHDPAVKEIFDRAFAEKLVVPIFESGDREAFSFFERRKIPRDRAKDFFYSKNYYELYNRIKELHGEKPTESNRDDKRVLWFFRDRTNFVVGAQGRSLDPRATMRYLTFKAQEDAPLIGGLERADFASRLYVTEGFIDSLFLPNSVSVQGLNANLIRKMLDLGASELVVVFDNEPANDTIKGLIEKIAEMTMVDERVSVCLLPRWLRSKGKDLNEYVMSGYDALELQTIVDENCFRGIGLKAASMQWNAKF